MVLLRVRKSSGPKVHAFDKSLEANRRYEAELDKHFAQTYDVTPATREQERLGIDRYLEHRRTGIRYSVEYKTDHRTHETGNVFVETVSVDTRGKRGWAYTSTAQVLVYFVPGEEYAMRADMTEVKRRLSSWGDCPEAEAWNRGRGGDFYRTKGLLVPVGRFRRACADVHDVAAPAWDDAPLDPLAAVRACRHDVPAGRCYFCSGRWKA